MTSTPSHLADGGPRVVPRHVAVIMDGNGRWAAERGLPRTEGHRAGMDAVRAVIEGSMEAGVEILTLFAFSTENWFRPESEIAALMGLLRIYALQEKDELRTRGVRVRVLGDRARLEPPEREAIEAIEEATREGGRLLVNLMVSYSGRAELVRACQALARRVARGELDADALGKAELESVLDTAGIPDPDLLVRTSGEYRISNFMLWQLAYTEIVTLPVLWPDFSREDLAAALAEYQRRERRFGRVPGSEDPRSVGSDESFADSEGDAPAPDDSPGAHRSPPGDAEETAVRIDESALPSGR
jgi:undecaprenyl diphosphate synthase